jgi:dTDP-glucose pyrophosphorylase
MENSNALENCLVKLNATIEEAIPRMDSEVAVIVDDDGRLAGIVTDGDIRRGFLKGATLKSPVSSVMTKNPITARGRLSHEEIFSIMMRRQIRHLPVVDSDKRPVAVEHLRDQYDSGAIEAAVLMAGGKGMRLRPLTNDKPKPLLKIGEVTILDDVLSGLKQSGISDVAISVNYLKEQIKDHVGDGKKFDLNVAYVEEKKELGTAGALSMLNPRPSKSFLVMNADLITRMDFRALARFHKDQKNDFTVCVRVIKNSIPYGVVRLNSDKSRIDGIDEKPEYDVMVNAGIYLIEPAIIDLAPDDTFFDMVSLIRKAIASGFKVGAFPVYEYWRDIGQHHEMRLASEELQRGVPRPGAAESKEERP